MVDEEIEIVGKCVITGNTYSVKVKKKDMEMYEENKYLIQNIFPYLSKGDREFIKTRISPEGWDQMFNDEEEQPVDKGK
jgi:hypothetical protein